MSYLKKAVGTDIQLLSPQGEILFIIKTVDPKHISSNGWKQLFALREQCTNEFQGSKSNENSLTAHLDFKENMILQTNHSISLWVIFTPTHDIIGMGLLEILTESRPNYINTNSALMDEGEVDIIIDTNYRRKRLASELTRLIAREILKYEKKSIRKDIYLSSGHFFADDLCQRGYGQLEKEIIEYQLSLSETNWEKLSQWDQEGQNKFLKLSIEIFNPIPETLLEKFCHFYNCVYAKDQNQKPITPTERKQLQEEYNEKQIERITAIIFDEKPEIIGYTEIILYNLSQHAAQALTVVQSSYQRQGLGKWLKAHIFMHLREHYPSILTCRSDVEVNNDPMKRINEQMGFIRRNTRYQYQFDAVKIDKLP